MVMPIDDDRSRDATVMFANPKRGDILPVLDSKPCVDRPGMTDLAVVDFMWSGTAWVKLQTVEGRVLCDAVCAEVQAPRGDRPSAPAQQEPRIFIVGTVRKTGSGDQIWDGTEWIDETSPAAVALIDKIRREGFP